MTYYIKILIIFVLGLGWSNYQLKADVLTVAHYSFNTSNNINTMQEIFKSIKGYPDYEVSNLGNVKSLARIIAHPHSIQQTLKERILKPSVNRNGYRIIFIYNGKRKTFRISQLMAIAFKNHVPNGTNAIVVDHINNNRLDDRLDNLQLITNRENCSKDTNGTSKYTGVSWCKSRKKWQAHICINGKSKSLGRFINELEASQVYQLTLKSIS
jgi:hypothetical protein